MGRPLTSNEQAKTRGRCVDSGSCAPVVGTDAPPVRFVGRCTKNVQPWSLGLEREVAGLEDADPRGRAIAWRVGLLLGLLPCLTVVIACAVDPEPVRERPGDDLRGPVELRPLDLLAPPTLEPGEPERHPLPPAWPEPRMPRQIAEDTR